MPRALKGSSPGALLEALLSRWKGVEGVSKEIHSLYRKSKRKGNLKIQESCLQMVIKVLDKVDLREGGQDELKGMTTEDLKRVFRQAVEEASG